MSLAYTCIRSLIAFARWRAPVVRSTSECRKIDASTFERFNVNVLAGLLLTVVLDRAVEALDVAWLERVWELGPGQDHAIINDGSATKCLRDEDELYTRPLVPAILTCQCVRIGSPDRGKLNRFLVADEPVSSGATL